MVAEAVIQKDGNDRGTRGPHRGSIKDLPSLAPVSQGIEEAGALQLDFVRLQERAAIGFEDREGLFVAFGLGGGLEKAPEDFPALRGLSREIAIDGVSLFGEPLSAEEIGPRNLALPTLLRLGLPLRRQVDGRGSLRVRP